MAITNQKAFSIISSIELSLNNRAKSMGCTGKWGLQFFSPIDNALPVVE